MFIKKSFILITFLLFSYFSFAKEQEVEIKPLDLKMEVRLIQVQAFVYDDKGDFVSGLSKDDFELYEDGIKQTIKYVDEINAKKEIEYTDVVSYSMTNDSITANLNSVVLIFDGCNSSHISLGKIKQAAKDFIVNNAGGRNYFALFGINVSGAFFLQEGFTNSADKLIKAIDNMNVGVGGVEPMSMRIRLLDSIVESVQRCVAIETLFQRQLCAEEVVKMAFNQAKNFSKEEQSRALRTVDSLINIFYFLRHAPGNKTVVFFSDGFDPSGSIYLTYLHEIVEQWKASYNITINVDQILHEVRQLSFKDMSNTSWIQQLINKANEAKIKFYWLNPQNPDELMGADSGIKPVVATSRIATFAMEHLISVSEDTGGFSIKTAAHLKSFFDKLASNLQNYYIINYEPARGLFDGKLHQIKIDIKKPGYKIQSRKAFLDYTLNDQISIMIAAALDFSEIYQQIPIYKEYSYLLDEKNKINVLSVISIPFDSLTVQYEGDKVKDQVHFAYLVKNTNDEIILKEHKVLNIDMNKDKYVKLSTDKSYFQNIYSFNLEPGIYKLYGAILELGGLKLTGWNQTLDIKVKNGNCFALNPLILGSKIEELSNSDDAKEDNSVSLLPDGSIIYKNNRVIMSAAKFYNSSDKLYGVYQIYNASANKDSHPEVLIKFVLYDSNSNLISAPPSTIIKDYTDKKKQLISNFFILPYNNLDAKQYKLSLQVKDMLTDCQAQSEAYFHIK